MWVKMSEKETLGEPHCSYTQFGSRSAGESNSHLLVTAMIATKALGGLINGTVGMTITFWSKVSKGDGPMQVTPKSQVCHMQGWSPGP